MRDIPWLILSVLICASLILGFSVFMTHKNTQARIDFTRANQQLRVELAGTWVVIEKLSVGARTTDNYETVIEHNGNRKMISVVTYFQKKPWATIVPGDRITLTVPPECTTLSEVIPKRF